MANSYGQLLCAARKHHDPPMSAKELADELKVKPPFITDIEKGRRLPSLDTQKKIKQTVGMRQISRLPLRRSCGLQQPRQTNCCRRSGTSNTKKNRTSKTHKSHYYTSANC